MTDTMIDRRDLMTAGAILSVGAAVAVPTLATAKVPNKPSAGFAPQPIALPFDPKTITGPSEKLLVSHHDNNYVGAVKRWSGPLGSEEGHHSIDVVARHTGFADRDRMRRAFVRAFGQPPQVIQRSARAVASLD